jgi:hypothetical protein
MSKTDSVQKPNTVEWNRERVTFALSTYTQCKRSDYCKPEAVK